MTVVWREGIFKKLLNWFSNQERIMINSFNVCAMNVKNVKMSPPKHKGEWRLQFTVQFTQKFGCSTNSIKY